MATKPHILAVAVAAAAAAEMFAQSQASHRLDLLSLCTIYSTVCPCLTAVSVGYSRMLAVVLELMVVYFVLLADFAPLE